MYHPLLPLSADKDDPPVYADFSVLERGSAAAQVRQGMLRYVHYAGAVLQAQITSSRCTPVRISSLNNTLQETGVKSLSRPPFTLVYVNPLFGCAWHVGGVDLRLFTKGGVPRFKALAHPFLQGPSTAGSAEACRTETQESA